MPVTLVRDVTHIPMCAECAKVKYIVATGPV